MHRQNHLLNRELKCPNRHSQWSEDKTSTGYILIKKTPREGQWGRGTPEKFPWYPSSFQRGNLRDINQPLEMARTARFTVLRWRRLSITGKLHPALFPQILSLGGTCDLKFSIRNVYHPCPSLGEGVWNVWVWALGLQIMCKLWVSDLASWRWCLLLALAQPT